jgi:modulator of FtsH protease
VLSRGDGAQLVMMAFGITAAIFFGMATLSTVIKRDLSNMGKFLWVGALILMVALLANIFIQSSALMLTLSVLGAGLFSAYMLYDLKRIVDGGETNYISATLALYLDVFNVFQFILSLLGFGSSSSD